MLKYAYSSSFTGRPLTSGTIHLIGAEPGYKQGRRMCESRASSCKGQSRITMQRKAILDAQKSKRRYRRQKNDVLGDYLTSPLIFRPFQSMDAFDGPLSIYTQPDPSIKRLENTSAKAGVATQAKGSTDPNCDLDKLFTLDDMLNSSKRLRKPDLRSQREFLADIFERKSRSAGSLSSNGDGMSPGTHKNQAGVSQFWYKENREAALARLQREQSNRRNALKYDKDVERVINFAKLGKLHDIKRMLQEGRVRDIDAHGKEGITALHAAAMSLNVRVMEYLIRNGASPKKTDILGRDIHSLIRSGTAANDVTHENHNRWLLDRALTVVSTESVFKAAQDGNEERLRWLLEAGINQANDRNRHSMSALHYAMMNSHKACSMLLIDFGANPNLENSLGQTPLQLAPSRLASLVRQKLDSALDVMPWTPLND